MELGLFPALQISKLKKPGQISSRFHAGGRGPLSLTVPTITSYNTVFSGGGMQSKQSNNAVKNDAPRA
jgi:hypothetical protein